MSLRAADAAAEGPSAFDARAVERAFMTPGYADRGLTFVRGDGVHLIDVRGRRWLDLMSSYGVSIFGHGHPVLVEALARQVRRLVSLHGSFHNEVRASAARRLAVRCGIGPAKVCFTNSGAEAVEAALKFAVLATGRRRFVACRRGFHGKTLGALSVTHEPRFRDPFEPLPWDVVHVDHGDLGALEGGLRGAAAFIVEPVQGEGGVRLSPPGYLRAAGELCRAHGALLILDEIQSGMGRTGRFLASDDDPCPRDILCLGKGLAGGMPAGAAVVAAAAAERIPRSLQTSTFGGNPLTAAGIVAALSLLDEAMLAHVRDMGRHFMGRLRALDSPRIAEVSGAGLMLGVRVTGSRDQILKDLQDGGVLAIPAGKDTVRFLPPYIIEREHVDCAAAALMAALDRE